MKRPNLQTQVLRVLEDNQKNNGSFLNYDDLASAVYGNGYIRKTASILIQNIKNSMGHVRELADTNGLLIIPLRKPTKANESNKWQVVGWKIAVKGFDEQYIADELLFRKRNGEARNASTMRFLSIARENKLISKDKCKELHMHLQEAM
jgi:hypothetical protein